MIAALLIAAAGLGLVLALVQCVALRVHLRRHRPMPRSAPFISVLKPLCGVDDDLWKNLLSFTRQRYPDYEVLLGVRDPGDPAYRLAREAAARWPSRVRVVVQRGAPGLNPKVNQLITLAAAARGEVLVVSDSNIRAGRTYLEGIAAAFDDPDCALATHPVAGWGERSLGAFFDNAALCGAMAPGVSAAKLVAKQDLVIGKSMALRRTDLRAMGGFERLKDVLAEDFVSGRIVTGELGRKVALVSEPVLNVTRSQCVTGFFARYVRWSVMQRKAVGTPAYAAQIFLHPVALGAAAMLAARSTVFVAVFAAVWALRCLLHESTARAVRGRGFGIRLPLAPFADLVLSCAWAAGLIRSEIEWRGNRLVVGDGTVLQRAEPPLAGAYG